MDRVARRVLRTVAGAVLAMAVLAAVFVGAVVIVLVVADALAPLM